MAGFRDFYERSKTHYQARAVNAFSSGVDDVRHKLIEEAWFGKTEGRTVTGDLQQENVPEIAPAAESPEPIKGQGAAPMHSPSFSYADWYRRQNATGEPVAADTIHGETRATDAKSADLYGTAPPTQASSSKTASTTMHDEAAWNREVRSSDLYGPSQTPADPSPTTPARNEPDHEPGH